MVSTDPTLARLVPLAERLWAGGGDRSTQHRHLLAQQHTWIGEEGVVKGCTTTNQTDPPLRLHLLGANWRPWHLQLKLSLSQKVGCTAEVVTQSGRQCIWAELLETGGLSATWAVTGLGRGRATRPRTRVLVTAVRSSGNTSRRTMRGGAACKWVKFLTRVTGRGGVRSSFLQVKNKVKTKRGPQYDIPRWNFQRKTNCHKTKLESHRNTMV